MNFFPPEELESVERDEHQAWLRLAQARDEHSMSDGEVPPEKHEHLHKLSEEWHQALDRLHAARGGRES